MTLRVLGGAFVFALAFGGALRADDICPSNAACNSDWQTFLTPINHPQGPGPIGPAYFDGWSWDSANTNIAYFIEGLGAFTGNPYSPDAQLPFWGNPDGSAVPSFYFQSDGQMQVATLLLADAQWAAEDSVGWYDPTSNAWGWIFQANGTTPLTPDTVDFTPTAEFGLFFVPDSLTFNPAEAPFYANPSYFTDEALNGIADADQQYASNNGITLGPESAYQHFAVFSNLDGGYYIGVNDRSPQVSDTDYNDMVFSLNPVPEPRTFGLAAAALAAGFLAIARRHRRASLPHRA